MKTTARRWFAWVLLLALAFSSAGTSFATRLSPRDLAALGICSLAAQQAGGDAAQQGQGDPGMPAGTHHCPLCAPAAHAVLVPSLPPTFLADVDAPSFAASFHADPPRSLYAGAIWRPRGPPQRA